MLKQRFLTGIILAPLVLAAIFLLPSTGFLLFIGGVIALGAWEWARMSGLTSVVGQISFSVVLVTILAGLYWMLPPSILPLLLGGLILGWLLAFLLVVSYPNSGVYWKPIAVRLAMGCWVLGTFWLSLVLLESMNVNLTSTDHALTFRGASVLSILLIIWSADTGAYFSGKALGKRKLAPKVSPGKSWEGVVGGLIASGVTATLLHYSLGSTLKIADTGLLLVILAVLLITALSVLGDLFESMFKRQSGFKDSSQLLPGHGGILDRIDSLTAAVPVFVICLWASV